MIDSPDKSQAAALTGAGRWLLLMTVSAGLFLIVVDNSVLYTALPTLTRELGATAEQSLWIINAYPLVMAGLLLGAGTLGDRIGHRRIFLIGLVMFGIASVAAAFAPTAGALIAARAFLAVGAAAMMPATLALIRITFAIVRERNFAIAVWGSVSMVGMALGPIIGGALLERFWWGSVFLINVPVVMVAIIATLFIAPKGEADPTRPWDLMSSVQVMVALVGLVFAIKEIAGGEPAWPAVAVALGAAALGSWAFVRRQRALTYPLVDFAIFRNRTFLAGLLAAGMSMFAVGGVQLVTTQRFQLVAGFSPLKAGLLVAAVAAGSMPAALLGGAFLHRIGLRPLISGGMAIGALGVLGTLAALSASLEWFIVGLVLAGMGIGAVMAVASTAIVGSAPTHRAGMASSLEEVSYELGSLTAVALLGSLISGVYSATIQLPPGAPEPARESINQALAIAGTHDTALVDAASVAYDTGYVVVMIVAAVVLGLGAAATGILLRRRDQPAH